MEKMKRKKMKKSSKKMRKKKMKRKKKKMKRKKKKMKRKTRRLKVKLGRIPGNQVADSWAGAVMRKRLRIQKCDRQTDILTDMARCKVACPRLKTKEGE